MGAVGLAQLSGLPSQRLGEWAWGYCWAGHRCRSSGATASAGGGCEGKIEKSITKASQKKRKEGETKGDRELQKAESYRTLLINSIRGTAFFLSSGTLMLHINFESEAIRSSHCESGPSHCQASLQWPFYIRVDW